MLRFGLLINACLFFLGCALLFAFGSAGSPCFDRKTTCNHSNGRNRNMDMAPGISSISIGLGPFSDPTSNGRSGTSWCRSFLPKYSTVL